MNRIQFYYRNSQLRCNESQTLFLEKLFGASRVITNRLANETKHMTDIDAASWEPSYDECYGLVMKLLNESDGAMYDLLTPELIRSIIVGWLSEWSDFRNKRNGRPQFKTSRQEQAVWLLNSSLFSKRGDEVSIMTKQVFMLTHTRIEFTSRPTACVIRRVASGEYFITVLMERRCTDVKPTQDEVMTNWGEKICAVEAVLHKSKLRYPDPAVRRQRNTADENYLMTLRKITTDRFVRACDAKARSFQESQSVVTSQ
jgi:hypothetical protein